MSIEEVVRQRLDRYTCELAEVNREIAYQRRTLAMDDGYAEYWIRMKLSAAIARARALCVQVATLASVLTEAMEQMKG